MRLSPVVCALLLCASAARADSTTPAPVVDDSPSDGTDDGFKQWVRTQAARAGYTIDAWWSAELDDDPQPERVARICPPDAGDTGYFLIEDGARHHRLRFSIDGRTPWCREGELDAGISLRVMRDDFDPTKVRRREPRFRRTRATFVEHSQGEHSSWQRVRIALRDGRPAIVWREQLFRPHCTDEFAEVVSDYREDWQALRAEEVRHRYGWRKGKGYLTLGVLGTERFRIVPFPPLPSEGAIETDPDDDAGETGFLGREVRRAGERRWVTVDGGRWPRVAGVATLVEVAAVSDE